MVIIGFSVAMTRSSKTWWEKKGGQFGDIDNECVESVLSIQLVIEFMLHPRLISAAIVERWGREGG